MLALNKKLIVLFIITLLIFPLWLVNNSFALVEQTSEFYVNDSAKILSQNTKDYIISINQELENKTGAQIVVVTVTTLDGMSIEDYALQLFRIYRYW